jgi:2-polyprenyl-6-hydroxyphenyl methylase/3-demethylubiquinone-9 3-methyltransferase
MNHTTSSSVKEINIWGIKLQTEDLSDNDYKYLNQITIKDVPDIEWITQEIDRIWDLMKLDNKKNFSDQNIGAFYSHPVWILNGIFSATDPISVKHRQSIGLFLSQLSLQNVADYGGGFGELAKRIRAADEKIHVTIVEPYPSNLGINRVMSDSKIKFVKSFDNLYECVIAQDVLEHVENPIDLALLMVESTKPDGYLLFANCFYPVIKCHLPSNFYLRHVFPYVVKGMGLKYIGRVPGAKHVLIFKKIGKINKNTISNYQKIAKLVGPIINSIYYILTIFKNLIQK